MFRGSAKIALMDHKRRRHALHYLFPFEHICLGRRLVPVGLLKTNTIKKQACMSEQKYYYSICYGYGKDPVLILIYYIGSSLYRFF